MLAFAVMHPEASVGSGVSAAQGIAVEATPSSDDHPSPDGDQHSHPNHPLAASVPTQSGDLPTQMPVDTVSGLAVLTPSVVARSVDPLSRASPSGRERLLDLSVLRI